MSRALSPATAALVPARAATTRGHRVRLLIVGGLAILVGLGLATAYTVERIWAVGDRDDVRKAGAIVVLGAAQYDGRPSPVFEARLAHAVELYRAGWAPWLIVTGGKRPGDRTTEAETAQRYAVDHGVPAEAILMEDSGRNTLESLRSVVGILDSKGLHDAVFVSDPSHMLRVLRIARDRGVDGVGSPTRTSPTDRDLTTRLDATVHELGALALYFVTGGGLGGD